MSIRQLRAAIDKLEAAKASLERQNKKLLLCRPALPLASAKAGAEGDLFAEGGENGLAVFTVAGGEEHAVRFEAAHLARVRGSR